jgi:hypothetical protein
MGLFSSKPSNRRRRSATKNERSWIDGEAETPSRSRKPGKAATPREQVHQLNAQIGAIESFLVKHHHAKVEQIRMKQENILPPPDRSDHRKASRTMGLAARRRYLAERNRNSFRFLLLFCTACALSWWLIFSGV